MINDGPMGDTGRGQRGRLCLWCWLLAFVVVVVDFVIGAALTHLSS